MRSSGLHGPLGQCLIGCGMYGYDLETLGTDRAQNVKILARLNVKAGRLIRRTTADCREVHH